MVNDELLKFVREQLAANVPQEQIVAILKPGGWTEADVAEALKALHVTQAAIVPAVPVPPPSSASQQKVVTESSVSATPPIQPVQSPIVQPVVQTAPSTTFPTSVAYTSAGVTHGSPEVKPQFQTAFRLQTMPVAPVSKKKWPLVILLVLLIVLIAGVGAWYFLEWRKAPVTPVSEQTEVSSTPVDVSLSSPATPSVPQAPFDADLVTMWTKIPDEQNSSAVIASAAAMLTKSDSDALSKYFAKGYDAKDLPTVSSATGIAARNVKTLQTFSSSLATPLYQCSAIMTPEHCDFEPLRTIGRLLLLRSLVLENANKVPEALSILTNLVDLGQKVTAGADEVVPLLVGWELQKNAFQRIIGLNVKAGTPVVFSTSEKNNRINTLRDEQKKVFSFMYSREVEGLEYLSDKNKVLSFPQNAEQIAVADEYRKSIALGKFNLEETKKYFYDSYKTAIVNVDVVCGGPLAKAPYDFSSEVNTATTTSSQSTIENYVGKILYWTTYTSFDSLNAKRCEVEDLINKL